MRTDDQPPRRDGDSPAGGRDAHGILFRSLTGIGRPEGYDDDADMADLVLRAGLVLSYKRASLADVYVASAVLLPPSLIRLADRKDKSSYRTLRAIVAAEHARPAGLTGLLRNEVAFQEAVVDALGCQTLIVLMDMLHGIIEYATSRTDPRSGPVIRHLAEVKSHQEIIRLVEAGRGQSAAALVSVRTKKVEGVIREYDTAPGMAQPDTSG
ncbi:MAG: FCD domain-containing protein [Mycobacterium sp.]